MFGNLHFNFYRFHAVGGPLPVSEPKFRTPLADAFLEAAHYLGNHVLDINAGKMKFKITLI